MLPPQGVQPLFIWGGGGLASNPFSPMDKFLLFQAAGKTCVFALVGTKRSQKKWHRSTTGCHFGSKKNKLCNLNFLLAPRHWPLWPCGESYCPACCLLPLPVVHMSLNYAASAVLGLWFVHTTHRGNAWSRRLLSDIVEREGFGGLDFTDGQPDAERWSGRWKGDWCPNTAAGLHQSASQTQPDA